MWKDYKIVNNLEVNCLRSEAIYCGHLSQWFKQIQQILVLQFFKNISSMIFIFFILFILHHANSKLYYAYFILRHGARYHTNSFFDGAQTMPLWGQNTPTGYRQMQRLGQLIRKEYIYDRKLLSQQYKFEELNVYCLDTNRSCTSIQSFMYGLYPQGTGPHMRKSFEKYNIPPYSNKTGMKQNIYALPKGFQPIKIKKFPATFYQCSKQASYRDKLIKKNQKNFNRITKQHQPFLKNISQMFQIAHNNITAYTVKKCFDTVMIDKHLGRPLPANFTESDFQLLKLFSNWYYHHITSDQEYFLVNTLSFSDIFNKFDRLIRDPDSIHRATFFGSQQTYLLPLSRAINISSIKCVEELLATNKTSATQCEIDLLLYSSSLIFQLYSKDQINFFVKVRSNGRYVKLCSQQREECDYEEFRKQVEKSMDMENIDFYCGGHIGNLLNFTKKYEEKTRNFSPLQYL